MVWVHAVSLGETRAAAPLVARIAADFPDTTILLTHMTATGREAGPRAVRRPRRAGRGCPTIFRSPCARSSRDFAPRAGLLMETELWPNLTAECRAAGVPLFLVNARLSDRSLAGYRKARVA